MKLAVTDSSVFIDLFEQDLITVFFKLPFEIHTTNTIYFELFPVQRLVLDEFVQTQKLTIYSLTESDWQRESSFQFSKGLSDPDKSVLIYAYQLRAIVLSGDTLIRKKAKDLKLDFHGILWIFDQLVQFGFLDNQLASDKLSNLIQHNLMYKNSSVMLNGLKVRLKGWEGK